MIINIILHSVTAFFGFYLFIVFTIWWNRDFNALYKYTCFLMLGIGINHSMAAAMYVLNYSSDEDAFLSTYVWQLKYFIMIIPLALYAKYVYKKIYDKTTDKKPCRRNGDK